MCGEHQTFACNAGPSPGSSPHVRGAPGPHGFPRSGRRDHPRMCGEHGASTLKLNPKVGSSPHVRGAQHVRWSSRGSDRDHPRMCGEHYPRSKASFAHVGSSPHVRGAHGEWRPEVQGRGIIPACAGSTGTGWWPCCLSGDHPRMCGEHHVHDVRIRNEVGIIPACAGSTSQPKNSDENDEGSSPHVRGALNQSVLVYGVVGIIPACAGSTRHNQCQGRALWDHPRMCGEHRFVDLSKDFSAGSSPHVRGAPAVLLRHWPAGGIIPACAGSTRLFLLASKTFSGSSPHVRGALTDGADGAELVGIIPACAGSTLKYLAFLGYSSAFSFCSQGSKLFTCVVSYPPNFRAL